MKFTSFLVCWLLGTTKQFGFHFLKMTNETSGEVIRDIVCLYQISRVHVTWLLTRFLSTSIAFSRILTFHTSFTRFQVYHRTPKKMMF